MDDIQNQLFQESIITFIPILVLLIITASAFLARKQKTVIHITITNFVLLCSFYLYYFIVNHIVNFGYVFVYEEPLKNDYVLNIFYELSFHIFGIIILTGVNIFLIIRKLSSNTN